MKKKHYIVIAVAAYFVFLIATIPAKPVIDIATGDNASVNIQGISGTLWNGKAYAISVNNNIRLKNTSWSFSVWKLFIGQVAADVHSNYLGNDIDTEIGVSFLGTYFANDLSATISAQKVAELADIPLAQLAGPISINIEHAQWPRGDLPLAEGVINWNNATVTVADTVALGNITITLSESDEGLLFADIKNQGGDIAITGNARLVPKADYAIDVKLSPTASAGNNIKQSLGLFAKKQPNGEYLFKNSGPLGQIGMM